MRTDPTPAPTSQAPRQGVSLADVVEVLAEAGFARGLAWRVDRWILEQETDK